MSFWGLQVQGGQKLSIDIPPDAVLQLQGVAIDCGDMRVSLLSKRKRQQQQQLLLCSLGRTSHQAEVGLMIQGGDAIVVVAVNPCL